MIDSYINAHEFSVCTPELLCKNIINSGCLFQEIYSIFNQKSDNWECCIQSLNKVILIIITNLLL